VKSSTTQGTNDRVKAERHACVIRRLRCGCEGEVVFRNLLVPPDGEVSVPAVFITPVPNYDVGETFMLGDGERLRILEIACGVRKIDSSRNRRPRRPCAAIRRERRSAS